MEWLRKIIIILVFLNLISSVYAVWDNNDVALYWQIGNDLNLTEVKEGIWNGVNDKGSVSPVDDFQANPQSALLLDISAGQSDNQINFSDIPILENFVLGKSNSLDHTICVRANFTPTATAEYIIQNQAGGNFHDLKLTVVGGRSAMQYTVGAGSATLQGTSQIRNNTWISICVTGTNATSNATMYVNCENQDSVSNYEGFGNGTGSLLLWNPGGSAGVEVDDFVFFNRTLTEEEICIYTNNTQKIIINETITVVPFLQDRLGNNLTIIEEAEQFFILANVTREELPLHSASCNMTASNITGHFASGSLTNITFNNMINTESLIVSPSTIDVRFDIVDFSVCRLNSVVDLEILFDGNLHRTIDGNVIPDCNIGKHTEINITKNRTAETTTNLTLSCPSCNAGNKQIILIRDETNEVLNFERVWGLIHQKNLTFNTTSDLFEFRLHTHGYLSTGVNLSNINITCNSSSAQIKQDVINVDLTIDILQINNIAYTDGVKIEAQTRNNITIDVFGDIIQNITFNVTYPNGTLIKSINEEFMMLNLSELDNEGLYNISIDAVDNDNTHINQSGFFNFNDTTDVTIIWINPNEDNSSVFLVNDTPQIELTLIDINLFAYEINITDPLNNKIFNFSATDITDTEILFLQLINFTFTGEYLINVTVSDDHTKKEIDDYVYTVDDDLIRVNFSRYRKKQRLNDSTVSIQYMSGLNLRDTELIKQNDRYTFNYKFFQENNIPDITHQFKIKCKELYFRQDSPYIAHFVCYDTKTWIDFETENLNWYSVHPCGRDCYRVKVNANMSEYLNFSSIGGLNIMSQVVSFQVVTEISEDTTVLTEFDLSTQTNVILLFVIAFLWLGVMIIGFFFKNFGFISMGFFLGIVLGFMFAQLHIFLTLIFFFINVMIFMKSATITK